jgi:opacity protein-like surface antigen
MSSVKYSLVAGAAALISTGAAAADLPAVMPPPLMQTAVVEDIGSGWYLRGDIGMSNQQVGSLFNKIYTDGVPAAGLAPPSSVSNMHKGFDAAPTFGVGVGYQWNNWLRFDLTGEYRGKANFHGLDIAHFPTNNLADEYHASKSEWVAMVNGYIDLGTWWCVTPFVGAGVGMAYNTIHDFKDISVLPGGQAGIATGATSSQWQFAWALHAGLAYKVTPGFTIELAYRYMNLGNAASGDLVDFTGQNLINNPMEFRNITSHDLKLGVRWMLDAPAAPLVHAPLMRRG